jgi:CDP-diacylglycerol--glycerol-3-phosphate 3-phosphatidyltransferase
MKILFTANLTLANRITLGRFLLIPIFILLTLYYMDGVRREEPDDLLRWGALMTFIITCVTDALDGYFARSRGERTRLGALLDPLADKSLLLSALILLTGPWGRDCFDPHLPLWYVLLVISRDVILVAGAIVIHFALGHADVRPRLSGKASTFFQMGLIVWILARAPAEGFAWLLWPTAGLTLLSALQYFTDGVRQLERTHAMPGAGRAAPPPIPGPSTESSLPHAH